MKQRKAIKTAAAAAALLCVLTLTLRAPEKTGAYFTDYTRVSGGHVVGQKLETEVTETVSGYVKTITIKNTGSCPAVVRVKAETAPGIDLAYSGDGWTSRNGYYEYGREIAPDETTTALSVTIDDAAARAYGETFEVTVIEEAAPAIYEKDGSLIYKWDQEVLEP